MSIQDPAGAEIFSIRLIKRLTTAPDKRWANTYECRSEGTATYGDLTDLVAALESFEQQIHHTSVAFDRAVISTYVPDSEPYNPFTFVVLPLNTFGLNAMESSPLSLNHCLHLRREVNAGRSGQILYRRTLENNDMNSPAGEPALANPAGINVLIDSAITASSLGPYLAAIGSGPLVLVMHDGDPGHVRAVTGLSPVGITIKAYNNKYFDRTPVP